MVLARGREKQGARTYGLLVAGEQERAEERLGGERDAVLVQRAVEVVAVRVRLEVLGG